MMADMSPADEELILVLAEAQRYVGCECVSATQVARACEMEDWPCWQALERLAAMGFVQLYPGGPGMSYNNAARLSDAGGETARALMLPAPAGPVTEFVAGREELERHVLNVIVEQQLWWSGESGIKRSEIRTRVKQRAPGAKSPGITDAIDALAGLNPHLSKTSGDDPRFKVTLRGLLASLWGSNAVALIDAARGALERLRSEDPTLWLYSWRELRKAAGLPYKALNLTQLSIELGMLGEGFGMVGSPPSLGWRAPKDLDTVLEDSEDALGHLRRCLASSAAPPPGNPPPVALKRRAITAGRSPAAGDTRPEPVISDTDYEAILQTMEHMVLVMERNPASFVAADEHTLRDHFLVQLNGQYVGAATGETFNVSGKTDILLRIEGRNAFIAECKFWDGPAKFTETIDQLLGYLAWRDTKTAIVLFNRNATFSAVLGKIPDALSSHSNFRRHIPLADETKFRAVLHHAGDPTRELHLTVLVFDVPTVRPKPPSDDRRSDGAGDDALREGSYVDRES